MSMRESLGRARAAKNDEFYTKYEDVSDEIEEYYSFNNDVFRDKTVLLPCDDPEKSNFTKYFLDNFDRFGLKRLISTSYNGRSDLLQERRGKIMDFVRGDENQEWSYLEGDGDFASPEVTALRDQADIVITNPPFSKFRMIFDWCIEGGVDFSLMGTNMVVTYHNVFPYFKD